MLGKGHAVSGITVWLAGWSWAELAGLAHPHPDVLVVGSLVAAGAALAPDLDHPNSRIALAAGPISKAVARGVGSLGATVHLLTRTPADRPDGDGHRTITHTFLFAALAGLATAVLGSVTSIQAPWVGRALTALLVFAFVHMGCAAARAALPGRRKRVRLGKGGRRWRKETLVAFSCAVATFFVIPDRVWWLGLAVGIGCATHCLGDMVTVGGCPVLWPVPIPSRVLRYDRIAQQRVPVRVWRTWYLFGTPQWARFRVGSQQEARFTWVLIGAGVLAVAVLVYAGGWGPGAAG